MSDVMEYKCPACGGAMEFDSKTQQLKCPYCDTQISVEEWERQNAKDQGTAQWTSTGNETWSQEETQDMKVYVCQSCGGEIMAEQTTGASSCPFCGNKIVVKGQFAGDLKPDRIIPFKLDKKAAKESYKNHLKGKSFLPSVFARENHIDEIKGVYIPFWLFDSDIHADVSYKAEKIRVWEQGDMEYTERKSYDVKRGGNMSFSHLPVDGSRKMDNTLMESIEPFDFAEAVPFQNAYLAGYFADRYDVEAKDSQERVTQRIRKSAESAMSQDMEHYTSVNMAHSDIHILNAEYMYVLYPVWLLSTTWNGEHYLFAMNGQTGKMVGDLPADKQAFWKYVLSRGAAIGAVLYGLMWLLMLL